MSNDKQSTAYNNMRVFAHFYRKTRIITNFDIFTLDFQNHLTYHRKRMVSQSCEENSELIQKFLNPQGADEHQLRYFLFKSIGIELENEIHRLNGNSVIKGIWEQQVECFWFEGIEDICTEGIWRRLYALNNKEKLSILL